AEPGHVTQTADDQAQARADVQAEEDAIGELEAVVGEEPDIGPLTDIDAPAPAAATPTTQAVDTRQRILDVALDLFTEQGYDGTSLRQIAEQLGVTKAALYYHFESKEDILMALHMRLHDFGKDALVRIGDGPVTLALWEELLDDIVGEMLTQRKIFLMHERNQASLEKLHREDHDAEHEDIQNQFRRILEDVRLPLRDRVRMSASFGVIFSSLFLAGDAFESTTNEELGEMLRDILHDVLAG
ncbi:MAG: TetR/AcrR family transcriptional regulator, partial [Acidimicrobiales bacterium]